MDGKPYSPKMSCGLTDFSFRVFMYYHYPFFVRRSIHTACKDSELHRHDFPQLWYCSRGKYLHYVEDKVYSCGEGSLIIIPPGVAHSFEVSKGQSAELFCIQGTFFFFNKLSELLRTNALTSMFLQNFSKELGFEVKNAVSFRGDDRRIFENALIELSKFNYECAIPDITQVRKRIEELFSLDFFSFDEKRKKRAEWVIRTKLEPIFNALLYINQNFNENITSKQLVKISAMSYSDFFKYFKKVTGVTFSIYLQMLRLRRALLYLAFTKYSFDYIATLCGFSNGTYFGRLFKKYYKRTPREERARQKYTKESNPFIHVTHNSIAQLNIGMKEKTEPNCN